MSQVIVVTGPVRNEVQRGVHNGARFTRFAIPVGPTNNTVWFNCSAWAETSRGVVDAIRVGSNVTVTGTLALGRRQDGSPAAYIRANHVTFVNMARTEEVRARAQPGLISLG